MAETHHVRQNIIMLVIGLVPICAVAKQSRPTKKNGCLGVLCRPFCLQPRYYGLPSLLKFDGPTSPGANYEKYDFSENRKVQNPPGWWVFLLTEWQADVRNGTRKCEMARRSSKWHAQVRNGTTTTRRHFLYMYF